MEITILTDNMAGKSSLPGEAGFSALITTQSHKILFDTGLGSFFAQNAEQMGIDLSDVTSVILSHGHYDHAEGIPLALKNVLARN